MHLLRFPILLSLSTIINGQDHQIPFTLSVPTNKRVAIIGSGAAGSSVAYHLSKISQFDVEIFEKSSIVGGRAFSQTFSYIDCVEKICSEKSIVIDLGASIIAESNRILNETATKLNVDKASAMPTLGGFGVFDGSEWRFRESTMFGFRYAAIPPN